VERETNISTLSKLDQRIVKKIFPLTRRLDKEACKECTVYVRRELQNTT